MKDEGDGYLASEGKEKSHSGQRKEMKIEEESAEGLGQWGRGRMAEASTPSKSAPSPSASHFLGSSSPHHRSYGTGVYYTIPASPTVTSTVTLIPNISRNDNDTKHDNEVTNNISTDTNNEVIGKLWDEKEVERINRSELDSSLQEKEKEIKLDEGKNGALRIELSPADSSGAGQMTDEGEKKGWEIGDQAEGEEGDIDSENDSIDSEENEQLEGNEKSQPFPCNNYMSEESFGSLVNLGDIHSKFSGHNLRTSSGKSLSSLAESGGGDPPSESEPMVIFKER